MPAKEIPKKFSWKYDAPEKLTKLFLGQAINRVLRVSRMKAFIAEWTNNPKGEARIVKISPTAEG